MDKVFHFTNLCAFKCGIVTGTFTNSWFCKMWSFLFFTAKKCGISWEWEQLCEGEKSFELKWSASDQRVAGHDPTSHVCQSVLGQGTS